MESISAWLGVASQKGNGSLFTIRFEDRIASMNLTTANPLARRPEALMAEALSAIISGLDDAFPRASQWSMSAGAWSHPDIWESYRPKQHDHESPSVGIHPAATGYGVEPPGHMRDAKIPTFIDPLAASMGLTYGDAHEIRRLIDKPRTTPRESTDGATGEDPYFKWRNGSRSDSAGRQAYARLGDDIFDDALTGRTWFSLLQTQMSDFGLEGDDVTKALLQRSLDGLKTALASTGGIDCTRSALDGRVSHKRWTDGWFPKAYSSRYIVFADDAPLLARVMLVRRDEGAYFVLSLADGAGWKDAEAHKLAKRALSSLRKALKLTPVQCRLHGPCPTEAANIFAYPGTARAARIFVAGGSSGELIDAARKALSGAWRLDEVSEGQFFGYNSVDTDLKIWAISRIASPAELFISFSDFDCWSSPGRENVLAEAKSSIEDALASRFAASAVQSISDVYHAAISTIPEQQIFSSATQALEDDWAALVAPDTDLVPGLGFLSAWHRATPMKLELKIEDSEPRRLKILFVNANIRLTDESVALVDHTLDVLQDALATCIPGIVIYGPVA
jgi:hypothetical protein